MFAPLNGVFCRRYYKIKSREKRHTSDFSINRILTILQKSLADKRLRQGFSPSEYPHEHVKYRLF